MLRREGEKGGIGVTVSGQPPERSFIEAGVEELKYGSFEICGHRLVDLDVEPVTISRG